MKASATTGSPRKDGPRIRIFCFRTEPPNPQNDMAEDVFERAQRDLAKDVIKRLKEFSIKPTAARVENWYAPDDAPCNRSRILLEWTARS